MKFPFITRFRYSIEDRRASLRHRQHNRRCGVSSNDRRKHAACRRRADSFNSAFKPQKTAPCDETAKNDRNRLFRAAAIFTRSATPQPAPLQVRTRTYETRTVHYSNGRHYSKPVSWHQSKRPVVPPHRYPQPFRLYKTRTKHDTATIE